MHELYLMVAVASRDRMQDFAAVYKAQNVQVSLVTLGHGTASSEMLNLFGLDSPEKAVCFAVVTDETWAAVKRGLETQVRIDVPGTGIAFVVPLSSIGGKRELLYLISGQNYEKGEETSLKDTMHELLVVISNQGCSDTVMDAARESGAAGGTVIHAKGTGLQQAEKFLGISLASEKDVLFIVVKTSQKREIMQSIMHKAGLETSAKAIVFSLPVTSTAGLRLLEQDEGQ